MQTRLVSLGSISTKVDYGLTASAAYSDTGNKFLRITDIREGRIRWEDVPYCQCSREDETKYTLREGDIVFARTGSVGNSCLIREVPEGAVFASYLIRIRPKSNVVDSAFLSYYFRTTDYWRQIMGAAVGAIHLGLNATKLKQLRVPLPPLPEQQRIAAILGRADRLRRLRRTARELGDTYLQSVFLEMFGDPVTNPMGWETRLLGKSLLIPPHIGTITPAQETGDQLCVRVGEVGQWNVDLDSCQRTSLKGRDLERATLLPGDIVLARAIGSQSHLGKLSILGHTEKTVVFDSHLMRLRLNESLILPEFFMCWMRTDGGRARFMKQARRTAVQFNINAKQIAGIGIPLPPLSLQNQFAHIVRKFERLRAQQREAERQAEHLFQALLHRAFRGEL